MADLLLRAMCFNIRYDNPRDEDNAWAHRREMALGMIEDFQADLIGLQEVLPAQAAQVMAWFSAGYEPLGVPREDGRTLGEIPLVLYRRDRFQHMRDGTFWLSQTPDVVGSRGWDAACTRSVTWAQLRDRRQPHDRSLYLFNCHWDHKGELARSESAKLMRRRIAHLAGAQDAVIITGDFNTDADSSAYRALLGEADAPDLAPRLFDTFSDIHPAVAGSDAFTYHGFTGRGHERIDWIVRNDQLRTRDAALDRRHSDGGRYPSDHFPVTAILEWRL